MDKPEVFKVGDLISDNNFPKAIFEVIGVNVELNRYYIKTIIEWDGLVYVGLRFKGLYLKFKHATCPSLETYLKYLKYKEDA